MSPIISIDQSYESLICGIIRQAYIEAERAGPYSEPWQWLVGPTSQDFCELLEVDHRAIRRRMSELEVEKHYAKPRLVLFLEAFILRVGGVYG